EHHGPPGPVQREPPVRAPGRAGGDGERAGRGVRGGGSGPPRLLGRAGPPAAVGDAVRAGPGLAAAVREVVRRRHAQRRGQLRRPPRRGRARRPRRAALGRRARGRAARPHVRRPAARGLQGGQRARAARGARRRPRLHLPADGPRGGHLDARLRPAGRAALRRLRRLLRAGAGRPHHRRAGEGRHHRGRRLPAREGQRPQGDPRRGARALPGRLRRAGAQAHRPGGGLDRGPRRVVVRPGGRAARHARRAGLRRRAAAVPALHLRHDRQAQGHPAHLRGLPRPVRVDALGRLRPQARDRRLLVHRRRRLGHRPQLHHVRAARQRRDAGDVRGDARRRRARPAVAHRRGVRRDAALHRAHADPHLHEVG
ncbi:MAG: Acetyl-CoA synthetase, partial [uncultured Solirubrobacteraceae bacterium]